MQPFSWPCGRLGEEGRRQVDIWPVCYCEFQILWLSPTLNLLEFFNLGMAETVHSLRLTSLLAHLCLTLFLKCLNTHTHTCMHACTHTIWRIPCLRKKKRRKKKTQDLTDSRARVRFRFNVRLHVEGGLWERVAGEELGLVCKGVGLAGVPHGSRPFCTFKPPDVTHRYLQAGWREAASFFFLTATEVALLTADGEFKIPLAVKDGDRQDKQETPDSRDF